MRLDIAVEIVWNKVVVTLVNDAVAESGKTASIAKLATFDGIEHLGEVRVKLEFAVVVGVAQILNIFCQIAEEEDIWFTNLAGDFDLSNY